MEADYGSYFITIYNRHNLYEDREIEKGKREIDR